MEVEPVPAPWGRLPACAAVAYRRRLVPKRQLADCQSAAAYQAAPQQLRLHCVAIPATLPGNRAGVHFYVAHPAGDAAFLSLKRGARWTMSVSKLNP